MWAAISAEEARRHPGPSHKTYKMVEAEAALGHKEAALADLAELAQRRDPELIGVVIDPLFSTMHGDPRFERVVASMGLPRLAR